MGRRQPTLHYQTNTHHTHSSSLLQLLSSLIPLSHLSTISPFHSTNSFTLVYFTNRGQLILRVHITNIHSTHSSFIPLAGDHSSLLLIQSLSFYQTLNIPIHFHSVSFIKWTHTSISNHSTILFYQSHSILSLFHSPHITHIHSMINELVSGWMDSFVVLWERVDLDGMWLEYLNKQDGLVSNVLLWVVWSDDWTETLSIHSIDRMDSCGVISTLQCFFHHWYHNECIPSLFIHLKEWERQTRSSYPILTLINPIHLYLISLFTHTHWTTVSQTIRWITNQRDAQSNSYTHTDPMW